MGILVDIITIAMILSLLFFVLAGFFSTHEEGEEGEEDGQDRQG